MPIDNDNDVKIFGVPKKSNDDMSEEIMIAESIKVQRRNGNSSKAKKLGIKLAKSVIESARSKINIDKLLAKSGIDDDYKLQADILAVFVAESSIEALLPSQFLAATAINSMYDTIMEQNEGLYEAISDSAEFSIYYLHLRRKDDVAVNIGKAFAMLCNKKDDELFSQYGKDFYELVSEEVEDIINKVKFN